MSKLTKLRSLYRKILLKVCDEVNLFDSDIKMTDNVTSDVRKRVESKIKTWKDEGILVGYLKYLVENMVYTYSYVIQILILGVYYEGFDEINDLSNTVFEKVARDCIDQLNRETSLGVTYNRDEILPLLIVPVVYVTYAQYLRTLLDTAADEIYKVMSTALTHDIKIDEDLIKQYVYKQANRVLCINDGKYSGALNETCRSLFNQLYIFYLQDKKVEFIAEIDEKTTEMCLSLNGQIFNVSDYNEFDRYSQMAGGLMHYKIFGLQPGVNLPPIVDHFHWCRSTVRYTT